MQKYTNGNPEDGSRIEQQAKKDAENKYAGEVKEEWANAVMEAIRESRISIVCGSVIDSVDNTRDEIYFTEQKYERLVLQQGEIKFKTNDKEWNVMQEMERILAQNGCVSAESVVEKNGDWYTVTVPFISEEERNTRINEDAKKITNERRDYIDVADEDVCGDCSEDGCDGKVYKSGMGSVGPRYECTRKECSFSFVRDVL